MNLEHLTPKQLGELEIQVQELLKLMHKGKLQHEALTQLLQQFEGDLSQLRRIRFDGANPEHPQFK